MTDAAAERGEAVDLRSALAAHHTDAFGFSLSCCGWDRAEAEDVLQATYLKVLDSSAHFAGRSSFRTWLFGVVRRTAAERRRQRWRRLSAWRRASEVSASATPADPAGNLDAEPLRRELMALPARQREVLHLVFYGDLSIAEAGEVMGVALGTARAHYERGKRRLRQQLYVEEG